MIQFVIGKSYRGSANEAFTVKARSEFFITLTDKHGNDFRKKIRSTNDYKEFVFVDGQTVCASRLITALAETAQQDLTASNALKSAKLTGAIPSFLAMMAE